MALAVLTLPVTVDTVNSKFTISALDINVEDPTMKGCLDKYADAFAHMHTELADIPDNDLTDQGKSIRDTPVSFP